MVLDWESYTLRSIGFYFSIAIFSIFYASVDILLAVCWSSNQIKVNLIKWIELVKYNLYLFAVNQSMNKTLLASVRVYQ